jgi:hypothetical protein
MSEEKKAVDIHLFGCDNKMRPILSETISVTYVSDLISICEKYDRLLEPEDITISLDKNNTMIVFVPRYSELGP